MITDILVKEHKELDIDIGKFLENPSAINLDNIKDKLLFHIYKEEEIIFPLIKNEDLKIRGLEMEHFAALTLLEKIYYYLKQNSIDLVIKRGEGLRRLLYQHNLIEESEIYTKLNYFDKDLIESVKNKILNAKIPVGWKCIASRNFL
ncbi:MAG: hemerythrin domain-containing protein [Candidatus Rehaiarchaeum fermentans]|nr:hemerythrin domain-containing protein [Candidatus Rehaiarchaeum fermentans]